MRSIRALLITLLGVALGVPLAATAQAYPSKPITWVVAGAPGGPSDALGRHLAEYTSRELGQPILIENIGSAGGTIAVNKVAKAPADGYQFIVGNVGYIAAAPSLYAKLPYDPVKDLEAVARFPDVSMAMYVNADSRFKSVADVVAYARENPGKLNVGDGGLGTASSLLALLFASKSGLKVTHVSYKNNTPALTDLASGQIDVMFDAVGTSLGLIKAGKIAPIAVASLQPNPLLPGVPPLAQTVQGFDGSIWFGLYAPKGTPRPIIDKVQQAYMTASRNPAFQQKVQEMAMQMPSESQVPSGVLQAFTAGEVRKWKDILGQANIRAQ